MFIEGDRNRRARVVLPHWRGPIRATARLRFRDLSILWNKAVRGIIETFDLENPSLHERFSSWLTAFLDSRAWLLWENWDQLQYPKRLAFALDVGRIRTSALTEVQQLDGAWHCLNFIALDCRTSVE